jgi:hypothetical protein
MPSAPLALADDEFVDLDDKPPDHFDDDCELFHMD